MCQYWEETKRIAGIVSGGRHGVKRQAGSTGKVPRRLLGEHQNKKGKCLRLRPPDYGTLRASVIRGRILAMMSCGAANDNKDHESCRRPA